MSDSSTAIPDPSEDPVSGFPDPLALTPGTAARFRETFSVIKNIPTGKTARGQNLKPFILRRYGTGNVGEMVIDFFFTDAKCL